MLACRTVRALVWCTIICPALVIEGQQPQQCSTLPECEALLVGVRDRLDAMRNEQAGLQRDLHRLRSDSARLASSIASLEDSLARAARRITPEAHGLAIVPLVDSSADSVNRVDGTLTIDGVAVGTYRLEPRTLEVALSPDDPAFFSVTYEPHALQVREVQTQWFLRYSTSDATRFDLDLSGDAAASDSIRIFPDGAPQRARWFLKPQGSRVPSGTVSVYAQLGYKQSAGAPIVWDSPRLISDVSFAPPPPFDVMEFVKKRLDLALAVATLIAVFFGRDAIATAVAKAIAGIKRRRRTAAAENATVPPVVAVESAPVQKEDLT